MNIINQISNYVSTINFKPVVDLANKAYSTLKANGKVIVAALVFFGTAFACYKGAQYFANRNVKREDSDETAVSDVANEVIGTSQESAKVEAETADDEAVADEAVADEAADTAAITDAAPEGALEEKTN